MTPAPAASQHVAADGRARATNGTNTLPARNPPRTAREPLATVDGSKRKTSNEHAACGFGYLCSGVHEARIMLAKELSFT